MRRHLSQILEYFAFFSYAPSLEEIHTFFPVASTKKNLTNLLKTECGRGKLIKLSLNNDFGLINRLHTHHLPIKKVPRYTLPQYSIAIEKKSKIINQNKSRKPYWTVQIYIFLLKILPFVRFVGITGATAMSGYNRRDDIDLFIIVQGGTLWSTRFLIVVLAKILWIHGGTGVCLNLFFDTQNVVIPKEKQNIYIAHELLQMKPIIDKGETYSLLIAVNQWILRFFPNASSVIPSAPLPAKSEERSGNAGMMYNIELLFKGVQQPIIRKNKTGFRITDHQLWLFKRDFERSLRRKKRL